MCGSVTNGATQHAMVEPEGTTEKAMSEGTQEARQRGMVWNAEKKR